MSSIKRFLIHFLLRRDKTRVIAVFGETALEETRRMISIVLRGDFNVVDFDAREAYAKITQFYGGNLGIIRKLFGLHKKLHVLVVSGSPAEANYKELKKNLGVYLAVVTPLSDI